MYTKSALKQQKTIKEKYPELWVFYNDMMGNFELQKKDIENHLPIILKWLKKYPDFKLIYQEPRYYLTNFED